MSQAIEAVKRGESVLRASKLYGVPRSTLQDRIKGKVHHGCKPGPKPYLTPVEEQELTEYLVEVCAAGYGKTRKDIMVIAENVVRDKGRYKGTMTSGWLRRFFARNPSLTLRRGDATANVRMESLTSETMKHYFELLKYILEKNGSMNSPAQMYNVDETGMPLDHRPPKVVAKRGQKKVRYRTSGNKSQITVIGCVNATGQAIPPFVIFDSKSLNLEWTEGEVPGTTYGLSDKGWVDSVLFRRWLVDHFLKHAVPARPLFLFLDGHSSHYQPELIQFATEHNIIVFCLPPHTTHESQPLDASVFGPLKQNWRNVCHDYMQSNPGKLVTKYQFSTLLKKAWMKTMIPSNICSGFRTCGVYPFNPKAVDCGIDLEANNDQFDDGREDRIRENDMSDEGVNLGEVNDNVHSSGNELSQDNLTIFRRCFEEGYDLDDPEYARWLEQNNPELPMEDASSSLHSSVLPDVTKESPPSSVGTKPHNSVPSDSHGDWPPLPDTEILPNRPSEGSQIQSAVPPEATEENSSTSLATGISPSQPSVPFEDLSFSMQSPADDVSNLLCTDTLISRPLKDSRVQSPSFSPEDTEESYSSSSGTATAHHQLSASFRAHLHSSSRVQSSFLSSEDAKGTSSSSSESATPLNQLATFRTRLHMVQSPAEDSSHSSGSETPLMFSRPLKCSRVQSSSLSSEDTERSSSSSSGTATPHNRPFAPFRARLHIQSPAEDSSYSSGSETSLGRPLKCSRVQSSSLSSEDTERSSSSSSGTATPHNRPFAPFRAHLHVQSPAEDSSHSSSSETPLSRHFKGVRVRSSLGDMEGSSSSSSETGTVLSRCATCKCSRVQSSVTPERNEEGLKYISKYLIQYVPAKDSKGKTAAKCVLGARVLTSEECVTILMEKEEKKRKAAEQKEKRKTERERKKEEKEKMKGKKAEERERRNVEKNLRGKRNSKAANELDSQSTTSRPKRMKGTECVVSSRPKRTKEVSTDLDKGDFDPNTCCICLRTFDEDEREGTGLEWVQCSCLRWLHEECIEYDPCVSASGKELLCPYCCV